jgi:Cu-Zn family superoxide dismutase
MSREGAVAVFRTSKIEGDVVATDHSDGVKIVATFTVLPPGKHGFHIHKAGDLRGEGCMGLCEHFDIGHHVHGGSPTSKRERHTGDLGNIEIPDGKKQFRKVYFLPRVSIKDLWGRSVIVHEDEDDLGRGPFEDSLVTGHAGRRMGCAIFGRAACSNVSLHITRKNRKSE